MLKLALHGGLPVRDTMLPYARQSIDDDDIQAVTAALKSDWLTTGPRVREFEEAVANYTGAEAAVAVNTGTAALHAAAFAAGISDGDEVILSPLTFVASANCVLYRGGKPVFADVDARTLNLDPVEAEKRITPRTRAMIAVDLYGHPCDFESFRELGNKYRILIIEDASHSLGARYHGRLVGTLSDMTTLSFHPVKQITTGEGGMVLSNDPLRAEMLRSFRHHGIDIDFKRRSDASSWLYDVVNLGYNYRITDICCALGISQLRKLEGWIRRRKDIVARYDAAFADMPEIETPHVAPGCESAWHLYVIKINPQQLKADRETIFRALRAENIGVNVHYIPIPWLGLYRQLGYQRGTCPIAESAYERLITLPLFPAMTEEDVGDVILALNKVIHAFRR